MVDLADLTHTDGDDNSAGIQGYIYIAKLADIETLPVPVLDDSTGDGDFADLVTISDDIIMLPFKSFKQVYVTLETGQLDGKAQGEFDGMSFSNEFEFLIPGSGAEALGFGQWVKNSNLIMLVPEVDGRVRLFGHQGFPAKLASADSTTGKKASDRKGITYKFRSSRKGPAPIFTGSVKLQGSSGVTGDQDIFFIS